MNILRVGRNLVQQLFFFAFFFLAWKDMSYAISEKGSIDFKDADWNQLHTLKGTYHYYPNVFLDEGRLASLSLEQDPGYLIAIPGPLYQGSTINGAPVKDQWGSLVLELKNIDPTFANMGIMLRGDSAYEVFIYDRDQPGTMTSLIKVGVPGSNSDTSIPQISFPYGNWHLSGSGNYLLIIHISGFHHRDSSIWFAPLLGKSESIVRRRELLLFGDTVCFSILLILTCYALSFYLLRKSDKPSLFMFLTCAVYFVRVASTSALIQTTLYTIPSYALYSILRSLEYGMLGFMAVFPTWYLVEAYKFYRLRTLCKSLFVLSLLMFFSCMFQPVEVFTGYAFAYLGFAGLIALACLGITGAGVIRSRIGGLSLSIGTAAVVGTSFIEMSHVFGFFDFPYQTVQYGICIMIFCWGQVLGRINANVYASLKHAYQQLTKVFYAHQISQVKSNKQLEDTMPTYTGQACALSFDIIGSSKIQHVNSKIFFRNTFKRCNDVISRGYDGVNLKANAFRIKEMGDGFLCSIGYPFEAMSENPANDSVDLAKEFAVILAEEQKMLNAEDSIACGIGIAIDTITGFYPESGTKEYDLYGPALILATRYEGMRKILCPDSNRSVLIIQEKVYKSLDPSRRKGFMELNLRQQAIVVRDDPGATHIYYQFLDELKHKAEPPPNYLQVV